MFRTQDDASHGMASARVRVCELLNCVRESKGKAVLADCSECIVFVSDIFLNHTLPNWQHVTFCDVATRHVPLATCHLSLATRHSPLATRHSPLATHHSQLATSTRLARYGVWFRSCCSCKYVLRDGHPRIYLFPSLRLTHSMSFSTCICEVCCRYSCRLIFKSRLNT